MNKYELIDSMIIQADALVDARGAAKCRLILDIISKLDALKSGLESEEAALKSRIEMAESEVKRLSTPKAGPGETVIGGEVYEIKLGGDE